MHDSTWNSLPPLLLSFPRVLVSNFARDMLSKIENDFVFSVSPSHQVYRKVGSMAQVKVCLWWGAVYWVACFIF